MVGDLFNTFPFKKAGMCVNSLLVPLQMREHKRRTINELIISKLRLEGRFHQIHKHCTGLFKHGAKDSQGYQNIIKTLYLIYEL